MGYIETILEPDERVMYRAKKHWIVYSGAFLLLLFGVCFLLFTDGGGLGFLLLLAAVVAFIRALIIIRTAEIAVTTRRLINKRGLIRRDTVEINASKIESIDLRQSILGRALDYGTVIVRGTGGMGSLIGTSRSHCYCGAPFRNSANFPGPRHTHPTRSHGTSIEARNREPAQTVGHCPGGLLGCPASATLARKGTTFTAGGFRMRSIKSARTCSACACALTLNRSVNLLKSAI